jgi:plastocyanin
MMVFQAARARWRVNARAALSVAVVGLFVLAGTAAGQSTAAISIVGLSFQPADVTVNAGDTVTWTVTQAVADPHTVTSGSGTPSGVFDSKITLHNNGDTFSYTFATPGTFPYYCTIHPTQMKGTITVLAAAGQSGPPASAAASLPPASAAPASAAPASAAPASSAAASPAASPIPGGVEPHAPIGTTERLIAAGIIGLTLVILFGAARLYRRVNR